MPLGPGGAAQPTMAKWYGRRQEPRGDETWANERSTRIAKELGTPYVYTFTPRPDPAAIKSLDP